MQARVHSTLLRPEDAVQLALLRFRAQPSAIKLQRSLFQSRYLLPTSRTPRLPVSTSPGTTKKAQLVISEDQMMSALPSLTLQTEHVSAEGRISLRPCWADLKNSTHRRRHYAGSLTNAGGLSSTCPALFSGSTTRCKAIAG